MNKFSEPYPKYFKSKIEIWKAPIPVLQILQSHSEYLLCDEDISIMREMEPTMS